MRSAQFLHRPWAIGLSLALILLSPSLIWVSLDRQIFSFDQAWYGRISIELYRLWGDGIIPWASGMIQVSEDKAPGLSWIGQFFVPLGDLMGSIDFALHLSVIIQQVLVLLFLYLACERFGRAAAIMGVTLVAASQMGIGLSQQFLTEPLQAMCIAWGIFLMSRYVMPGAGGKGGGEITAEFMLHFIAWGTMCMLAKTSSPLYLFFPGLILLAHLWVRPKNISFTRCQKIMAVPICISGFVTIVYYVVNLHFLVGLLSYSSKSTLWGQQRPFGEKILYWSEKLFEALSSMPYFGGILLCGIIWFLVFGMRAQTIWIKAVLWACALEIPLVLSIFSFQLNETTRYLYPLLPIVGFLGAAMVSRLNRAWIYALVICVNLGQWAFLHHRSFTTSGYEEVAGLTTDTRPSLGVAQLVESTCLTLPKTDVNMVGVDLGWLNMFTLNYYAAKDRRIRYHKLTYIGYGFAETDPKKAAYRVFYHRPLHYVTLKDEVMPSSDDSHNRVSAELKNFVIKSGLYSEVPQRIGPIEIYRRRDVADPSQ
ncbi:MAG: hypothetical protein SGI71_00530 [Verrucomicrobiota bacterium]|nr:hypothetical protein [Verrucomicrobiota bacterium]